MQAHTIPQPDASFHLASQHPEHLSVSNCPTTPDIPASTAQHISCSSETEPESDVPGKYINIVAFASTQFCHPVLECTPTPRRVQSIFATPSPPPPGSLYWKYVTPEEDAQWYDCAGKNSQFDTVRRWKKELENME